MDLLGASAALSLETSPSCFSQYILQPERDVPPGCTKVWRRRGPPHGFTLQGALCAKHGAIALFPEPASYPRCSSFREMKLETFSPCYLISLPPVSSSRFLWSSPLLLEFSRLGSVNPDRTWKVPSVAGGSSASPGAWGNSSLRAGGLPGRRARTRWRSRARLRPQRPPRRLFISASSV